MYQAIEATSKSGVIRPLEPVSFVEDERLIILRLSKLTEGKQQSAPPIRATDWRQWAGVLKDSPHLNDDPVSIQRTMRNEWG